MTKTELTEKVGKKFFLADDYTLAAKLKYESGIPSFEKYLNGKTLKQNGALIHLTKYPKGLVIKIAKLISSFPFGIAFSEIKRISLVEKPEASKLIFETSGDGKIIFSLKTADSFDVRQFLEEIHISYDNIETKSKGDQQKSKQKTKENNESHSEKKQEEKGNEQQNNRQSFNDGNNNRMSKDKAFIKASSTNNNIEPKMPKVSFTIIGAILGLPLSYYFQPEIIRRKMSLLDYTTKLNEVFEEKDLIGNVIVGVVIFAVIGYIVGYFMDKNAVKKTD